MYGAKLKAIFITPIILTCLGGLLDAGQKGPTPSAKQDTADEKTIQALIMQLGDESFDKREAAYKRLSSLGKVAQPLLQKAAKDSTDAEVRERVERLLLRLSEYQSTAVLAPEGLVFDLAFSKDGQTLAAACSDKTVRLYDWKNRQVRLTLGSHDTRVWSVAFSPDGEKLASCTGEYGTPLDPGEVKIWNLATGKEDATLRGHRGLVFGVAYSPDGKTLYSASWDGTIKVWDIASGKEKAVMRGHTGPVRRVVVTPNGKWVASTGNDGSVRFWSPENFQEVRQIRTLAQGDSRIAFTPDGKLLITSSRANPETDPGIIKVWNAETGEQKATIRGPTGIVLALAVSPNGKYLAMGGGLRKELGEVKVFDLASGRLRGTFVGHKEWVESVTFSPDGAWLVSGGGYTLGTPGEIRIWDLRPVVSEKSTVKRLALRLIFA
jgi:tricorn protease-like protein